MRSISCQFLIGKVQLGRKAILDDEYMCQFLIGKVQRMETIMKTEDLISVSIPHRQGTTSK